MTARRDFRDFLNDMVAACRSMLRFVDGLTVEAYAADEKTRYAVMRAFEILGEAARQLPDEVRLAHPAIPWATMMAVRNRIAHGYFGVDDAVLFSTIHNDVVPLLPLLEGLLIEYGADRAPTNDP